MKKSHLPRTAPLGVRGCAPDSGAEVFLLLHILISKIALKVYGQILCALAEKPLEEAHLRKERKII